MYLVNVGYCWRRLFPLVVNSANRWFINELFASDFKVGVMLNARLSENDSNGQILTVTKDIFH